MKKLLTFVLAALLIVGLLPMAAMAEAPASVKVSIYNGVASDFSLTLNDGDEVYLVAGEENVDLIKWTEAEAPTDKFVKFTYAADTGIVKTTYQNLVTDQTEAGGYTCHGTWYKAGDYAVEIELIGTNSLTHGVSSCIKFENTGDITISGSGSLELNQSSSAPGTIWCAGGGNLIIKNTNLKFSVNPGSDSALHHGIFMAKGSVAIEGSKIESLTLGGRLVYLGTTDKEAGGKNGAGRYTLTTDATRTIKIKDSEIIAKAGKTVFSSASPATIENCTMKLTLSGSSGPVIEPVPTMVGDYTAIGGLAKNADKPDKLKAFDMGTIKSSKLSGYTYVNILNYATEEETTEATVPETTPPEVVTPENNTPENNTPDASTPENTTPENNTPENTTPAESKPAETTPATTAPAETDPVDTNDDAEGGSPLKVVLIVMIVLIVVAGGAFATLFILKKKGIIK